MGRKRNTVAFVLGLLAGALVALARELGLVQRRIMCRVESVEIDTPAGIIVHTTAGDYVTRDLSAGNVALEAMGAPVLILYRERHGRHYADVIGRGLQVPSSALAA